MIENGDELRIGTAERESAVQCLSDHMAAGRLTIEEYEERMAAALEARTKGDVRALFTDLPAPYPHYLAPPPPALPPPTGPPVYVQAAPPPAWGYQSERYRVVAGVMQLVFPFGIGRFYTGHIGMGVAQAITSFMLVGIVWCWIDGIIMLANGGRDAWGRELR